MTHDGTGDNQVTGSDGTVWNQVTFFIGDMGTGDRRAYLMPDGYIREINE